MHQISLIYGDNMERSAITQAVADGASISEMATKFGIGKTSIRYWLKKFELKTVRKPRQIYVDAIKSCQICGKEDIPRWLCSGCYTKVRRYRQKTKAIKLMGGKCSRCGWAGNIAALEFHHIDGSTKELTIGNVANKSWDTIKHELAKCELLCSCCHRIEHSNNESEAFLAAIKLYQGRP
jgi:hypothetical protein